MDREKLEREKSAFLALLALLEVAKAHGNKARINLTPDEVDYEIREVEKQLEFLEVQLKTPTIKSVQSN